MDYYNQQQPFVVVSPRQGYPPEGYLMYASPLPGYPLQGYTGYPQGYQQGYLFRDCYFIQNNIFVCPQGYTPQGYPPQYPPPRWLRGGRDGFAKGWLEMNLGRQRRLQ